MGELVLGESATAALEVTSWETEAGRAGAPLITLYHVPPWCNSLNDLLSQ